GRLVGDVLGQSRGLNRDRVAQRPAGGRGRPAVNGNHDGPVLIARRRRPHHDVVVPGQGVHLEHGGVDEEDGRAVTHLDPEGLEAVGTYRTELRLVKGVDGGDGDVVILAGAVNDDRAELPTAAVRDAGAFDVVEADRLESPHDEAAFVRLGPLAEADGVA